MTRKYQTIMYLVLVVLFSACNADSHKCENKQKEMQALLEENELLKKENELLKAQNDLATDVVEDIEEDKSPEDQPDSSPEDSAIRIGQHNFTLQWIGWENPGKVEIARSKNNKYSIVGSQKSDENDDYVNIDGELTVLDDKTLLFEGKLVSQVSYINEGKPCERTEPLHFRITGNRKYWRLQEKDNCGGGNVVDYVDIYF